MITALILVGALVSAAQLAKAEGGRLLAVSSSGQGVQPTQQSGEQLERQADEQIEVEYAPNADLPYRERRQTWAFMWGLNLVTMYPSKMMTNTDITANPNQIKFADRFYNQNLYLYELEALAKLNFGLGSIAAGLILGTGELALRESASPIGKTGGSLLLIKSGGSAYLFLDSLFAEPYIVPYVGAQIAQMNYRDVYIVNSIERNGTVGFSAAIQSGFLLQLNALDRATAFRARKSFGIENTFIDLFVVQHSSNPSTGQPNLTTNFDYGFGFRVEH